MALNEGGDVAESREFVGETNGRLEPVGPSIYAKDVRAVLADGAPKDPEAANMVVRGEP